jgi:membrane fusion protein, heavy metal efflux system
LRARSLAANVLRTPGDAPETLRMKLASILLTLLVVALSLSACDQGRSSDSKAQPKTAPAPTSSVLASVELSPEQARAIRMQLVASAAFYVERSAVGNVGFEEDLPIVQAESTLIGAAATLTLTRKELARLRSLGEANGVAQKDIDQAIADQQTATAALQAARDSLRALGKTEAQIERIVATGKFDRDATRSTAKWVVAAVNESDSPLIRVGQAVAVKVAAYPDQVFPGRVSLVYATVDPDTHRMTARVRISDPNQQLRPGMLADVTIRISGPVNSPAVPASAVVREGDGTMIAWVKSDADHFVQRPLKLGLQNGDQYQVLDGVRAGELLVVDGGVFLSNLLEAPPSD